MTPPAVVTTMRTQYSRATGRVREAWDRAPSWQRWTVYVLLIIGVLLLPTQSLAPIMSPYTDWPSILFFPIGTFIVLAIGLNVVVGQAGLLDLGFVAFYAVGGYTMGLLGARAKWPFWVILPVGSLICAASGILLGAPTLRLRGDYLAIVT
ncbi:MAG: branched-chain amino acid ABC transporter permease, partial [Mycobacteriales bacterium]